MKKASIRDLHIRTSELVREAAEPLAELRPSLPDLTALWRRFPWSLLTVDAFLRKTAEDVHRFRLNW